MNQTYLDDASQPGNDQIYVQVFSTPASHIDSNDPAEMENSDAGFSGYVKYEPSEAQDNFDNDAPSENEVKGSGDGSSDIRKSSENSSHFFSIEKAVPEPLLIPEVAMDTAVHELEADSPPQQVGDVVLGVTNEVI